MSRARVPLLTPALRLLADFEDTLAACRCPNCAGVFYTIAPRFDVPGPASSTRPRGAAVPSKAAVVET